MKKFLIIWMSGLFALTAACQEETDCCDNIPGDDTAFAFNVSDEQGSDLLDPDVEKTLNTDAIRIQEYKDGQYVVINNPDMDASEGYKIYQEDDIFKMRLFPGEGSVEGDFVVKRVIVKWNESVQDSLVLTHTQNNDLLRLVKISYNGEEVWDQDQSGDGIRYFRIQK